MVNIIASAARLACALAGVFLASGALASDAVGREDDVPSSAYSALPGGYSLSYDKDEWNEEYSVFQLAVVDRIGVIGSGFAASADPRLRPLTRLDSAWNFTAPWGSLPMRVGDGVSSVGLWDQPARMGGIQIGTYQPAPPEVVAPPSVIAAPYESPGPVAAATPRFIDHLRSIINYQPQSLTAAGQGDFSLESGRLRENFEVRSDDYGPWITSGTYRYGLNTGTTLDGQFAQVQGQQSTMGVGLLEGMGPLGLVSARVASSRDLDATGWLARLGYDYSHDRFNVSVRSHFQSPGYQEVGDSALTEPLRQRTLASAGVDLGSMGVVSFASATQTYTDDSRRDIVALSHAMPLIGGGIFSTAAAYSPGQYGSSALWLSFSYPFDFIQSRGSRLDSSANSSLDRSISDAFGQGRAMNAGHMFTDKLQGP